MVEAEKEAGPVDSEEWRRFTPKAIDSNLCMARTWNLGAGGQCSCKPSQEGKEFCTRHFQNELWKVHGRVDGEIPEKKLREFVRTAKGEIGQKRAKSRDKGGKDKPNKKAKKASESKDSSQEEDRPSSSGVSRTSPSKKSATVTTPPPKSSRLRRSRRSNGNEVPKPRNTKVPKKETRRATQAPASKAPKCTCGKPIHTEKCKLFRPGFIPARRPRMPRPVSPRFQEPMSPVKTVPPPSVKLSRVASEQVLSISEEIARLPKPQRKAAWKQQMRTYHPDKKSVFPNLNESQMNEVFVEIKRRYDFAMRTEGEQLIPPARQFWGSCR